MHVGVEDQALAQIERVHGIPGHEGKVNIPGEFS